MEHIIKRDGKVVAFDSNKIKIAITKALASKEKSLSSEKQEELIEKIIEKITVLKKDQTVEQIQDHVESKLIKLDPEAGRNFIVYRRERTKIRNKKHNEMVTEIITVKPGDLINENANQNAETPSGMMSKIGFETAKAFSLENLVKEKYAIAHERGDIYLNDLDWYSTGALNCLQSDFNKILQNGFDDINGGARPAKRLATATGLTAISLQKSQNLFFGGQAAVAFDFNMAPFVTLSFKEHLKTLIEDFDYLELAEIKELNERPVSEYTKKEIGELKGKERIWQLAINKTVKEARQAMEGLVHDLNLMQSRGGCQTVFSSINFGTDFSAEGRLVTRSLLEAFEDGVGIKRVQPIFPILIFKVKKGINRLQGDPNKDLYEYSKLVAAKRFYPTFVNLDATFNFSEAWDVTNPNRYEDECSVMGCRTRVFENRNGKKQSSQRGNACFGSVNLPRLGILANKNKELFFEMLEEKMDLLFGFLRERFEYQCKAKVLQTSYAVEYLMKDGEKLNQNDEIREIAKHFTLGVGYIGLAETLIALTGKHHGESSEAQNLGLEIISYMQQKTKQYSKEFDLNVSVFAVPAEGLANKFTKLDVKEFGVIPGITDKGYYTNSHQIPMAYKMPMSHKIRVESPYHELTLAGHILRLEFDGDPSENLEAVSAALELALDSNAGYIGINHNDNYCNSCGENFKSRNTHECPKCGSTDIDTVSTITGYLTSKISKWNPGKQLEFYDRIGQNPNK